MKVKSLEIQRDNLRSRWREVRIQRLELKKILFEKDYMLTEIRHNPEYKKFKKKQKHISGMIRHIETKICKGRKDEAC